MADRRDTLRRVVVLTGAAGVDRRVRCSRNSNLNRCRVGRPDC